MQDLKLNGIYIAKSGQLFHNYQKLKVLEITTNTYYIHWLDADNEVRYHKREFASYYEIVETLEEPKLTEPTTNHLAENFIDITNKELKNNENKTSEYLIRQQNSYMMNKAYKNRYLLGEFEKIAPNLLGPFLDPMRSMLKQMLCEAKFPLYGLDKKIDIDMPAMPTLGDLDFSILLEALLNNQAVRITLLTEAGAEASASGLPVKLQIAADKWVISLRPESCRDVLKIDVGQIIKVVAMSEDLEEQK